MERSFKNDYAFGLKNEIRIKDILIKNFTNEIDIKRTTNKFCKYDFESEQSVFELKTRRIEMNKYPTTIIQVSKIKENSNSNQYFVFDFLDACCYIKYEKNTFDLFEIKNTKPNYRSDKFDHLSPHFFIPIKYLKKLKG